MDIERNRLKNYLKEDNTLYYGKQAARYILVLTNMMKPPVPLRSFD